MTRSPLPLSVAIVCKNNESTIERTLASVAGLAAEIVALDSGSTDRTLEILARHAAVVQRVQWQGHVKTKQAALEACTQPWILSLDSDESLEPPLAADLERCLAAPRADAYELRRMVFYRGRFLRHAWQPEWRLRLVRRGAARWTGLDPHDKLVPLNAASAVGRCAGILRHDSFATFADHFRAQCAHSRTMAASLHAAGKRGSYLRLLTSPPGAFFKQMVIKRAFFDGYAGWLAAASTAAGALMKHAMLLELSRAASSSPDA